MNGVISWYVLALQLLFYFIACVSFLSISLYWNKFVNTYHKTVELFLGP